MMVRFATVMEEEILQMNEATPVNTRQLSPSGSVPSDLDIYLTATRFGQYQSLVTSTSEDSNYIDQ